MCQLLGMNCNVPTDICFSFEGFCERGGATGTHEDGWGIAFFEGKACRVFVDTQPSANSPIAELVKNYPIKSLNTIAHIRKATIGAIELSNTQPYRREAWGLEWIFAHNGDLWNFNPTINGAYQPVGTSDSERAFCTMLNSLKKKYPDCPPPLHIFQKELEEICNPIAEYGTLNFLLSNGQVLFARCSTELYYIVREAPFDKAHLKDKDISIDFSQHTTENDRVAVIATEPLTDNEHWTKFEAGQLITFKNGQVL
ncbi:MAG: class II glutamine amidotransferase [Lentisphaeraceae bacterium]|nr:class II glutamine amidotransferase [Lentisphaeraceae bacterium]